MTLTTANKIDLIKTLRWVDDAGEPLEAETELLETVPKTEFNPLDSAIQQAEARGFFAGSVWSGDYPNLILETFEARVQGLDGSNVRVSIRGIYRRMWRTPTLVKGGTSLRQIRTDRLPNGDSVKVTYNDQTQGKEISVFTPTASFSTEVTLQVSDPDSQIAQYTGKVNISAARGFPARTLMCVSGAWEPVFYGTNPIYRFTYDFEAINLPEGYDTYVTYTDPETGEIPGDVDDTNGRALIEYQEAIDFSPILP